MKKHLSSNGITSLAYLFFHNCATFSLQSCEEGGVGAFSFGHTHVEMTQKALAVPWNIVNESCPTYYLY